MPAFDELLPYAYIQSIGPPVAGRDIQITVKVRYRRSKDTPTLREPRLGGI